MCEVKRETLYIAQQTANPVGLNANPLTTDAGARNDTLTDLQYRTDSTTAKILLRVKGTSHLCQK